MPCASLPAEVQVLLAPPRRAACLGCLHDIVIPGSSALALLPSFLQAFKAAEAAKKARELVRRKGVLTKSTLPGKLADCSSSDRAATEIFLVEGDSAGVLPFGCTVLQLRGCEWSFVRNQHGWRAQARQNGQ